MALIVNGDTADTPIEPEADIRSTVSVVAPAGAVIPLPELTMLPVPAVPEVALKKNVPLVATVELAIVIGVVADEYISDIKADPLLAVAVT